MQDDAIHLDRTVGGWNAPQISFVRTASSEACGYELLRLNHLLNRELKIGEGIAIKFDGLFDAVRPRWEIRACWIMV